MSTNVQRLRKYELHERLGSNNLAEVWKAFDPELQSYVALKIFQANLQNDPAFMTRFWNLPFSQEAQKILSLHHPHIVHIHSFQISRPSESESPLAYVVMDYIDGSTLADYIRGSSYKGESPSAAEVVHLFASIGAAVDYVHQQGVIHGHIKPTNVLLDKRNTSHNRMGEPMLTDIGIAKLLGTSTGALNLWKLDTPLYISPEQVQEHPTNEHSDIYCLGIILYEICTGEPPFHGENKQTIMLQHVNAMPPSPSQVQQNISPALSEVIMRGLAKDPAERFPSAASLVTALAEALDISIPKIPSPSINATNTTSSPANANPARPGLSPSSTTSTGTLPSHSAGQTGHTDHAIHAMNGQTNHKTKLSVAAFALRSHAPSPETALPSDPSGESAPQFAT